jgi:TonB family protein
VAAASSPIRAAQLQAGGFGDIKNATAGRTATKPDAESRAVPAPAPIEILVKPKPAYTEEARQLRVEGEVMLEVIFTAAGEVRVLRVVRGLGHGLDENAITAARAIRYRPAQRDGKPVDSTGIIRIEFELAY